MAKKLGAATVASGKNGEMLVLAAPHLTHQDIGTGSIFARKRRQRTIKKTGSTLPFRCATKQTATVKIFHGPLSFKKMMKTVNSFNLLPSKPKISGSRSDGVRTVEFFGGPYIEFQFGESNLFRAQPHI